MPKKKPLDIGSFFKGPSSGQSHKKSPSFPAMLAVAALLIAAIGGIWLLQTSGVVPPEAGSIQVVLQGPTPLLENGTAKAMAFSSCGSFSLFLDGAPIASGTSDAQSNIALRAGSHELVAKNAQCSALLDFMVRLKECDAKQTRACTSNGCSGTQTCFNGIYGSCVLPKKTCVPGRSIGCSSDSCKFGYMQCNPCGTGYGPCLPPGSSTPPCNGASCG